MDVRACVQEKEQEIIALRRAFHPRRPWRLGVHHSRKRRFSARRLSRFREKARKMYTTASAKDRLLSRV